MVNFKISSVISFFICFLFQLSSSHVCMTDPSTTTLKPIANRTPSTPKSTVKPNTRQNPEGSSVSFESNAFNHGKKMVCYYGSWAVYRPEKGKFPVENIDPFLCTHVIYTFAGLGYDNKIRPLDPWNDLRDNYGKGAFERFTKMKEINPKLKTLIAIGGWNEGSIKYSGMAASPDARRDFIDSVLEFLPKYNFDGLDLDWEYPAARGGKPEDKANFASLVRELKTAFGSKYLLTAAVSAGKWFIDPGYDVPVISSYLDFINVMAYDYHGGWEDKTGHNAPVYARPEEVGNDRISNVNYSMHYWIERGAPPEKIILGMGTYGRSFTLARQENNGLQAPAPQKGMAGPYTREPGSLGYNEICESFRREKWTIVNDPYHLAPYAYKERQWVGYDDIDSIAIKSMIAVKMGLGGGMVWSLETDDFHGECHGVKFPLIQTINRVFATASNPVVPTPPPTPETEADGIPVSSSTKAPSGSSSTVWWEPSSTHSTPSSTSWTQTSSTTTEAASSSVWGSDSASTSTTTTSSPRESSSTSSSVPSSSIPWWETTYDSGSSSTSFPFPTSSPSITDREYTTPKNKKPDIEREHEEEVTPSSPTREPSSSPSWWTWSTPSSTSRIPELSTSVPVRPNDRKGITCKSAGMFRNPNDCKRFFRCVEFGFENRFMIYEYSCPTDTVFDEHTKLCMWPDSVPECSNYYSGGSGSGASSSSPSTPSGSGNEVEREERTLIKVPASPSRDP